jgi:PAS domain S-box-containing protein
VYLLHFDGSILDANDAALNLLGYTREEIPLYNIASLVATDQVPLAFQIIDEIRQNGTQRSPIELRVKKKNGEYVWLEAEGALIQRDGKPYAVQGIARDITCFKVTEQRLMESENCYRAIFENTGTATVIIEEDSTISMMNRECENLSGYSKEKVEGKKSWADFIVKEDLERLREYHRLRRSEPDRVPKSYEARMIDKQGDLRDILVTGSIIPGTKKGVASLLDITERKAIEKGLKESEAKFRALVEQIPNSVIYMAALDESSTTLYVSPQINHILGYTQKEYKENPDIWSQRIHPDDYGRVIAELEYSRRTEQPFISEYRILRKDDRVIWFHDEAHIFRDEQGNPLFLLGINTDITERKQAEEKLRERERDLEIRTKNLEEMNTALNVLLEKRKEDKAELEEKVLQNAQQLIEPYMAKLKLSGLDERQKALVSILESNLKEMTSSFAYGLSSRHLNLTPKEVNVANLIKQGMTTKEICGILGSSEKVIAFHRQNIRKKLGLRNKKINLKSYLAAKV